MLTFRLDGYLYEEHNFTDQHHRQPIVELREQAPCSPSCIQELGKLYKGKEVGAS
jgi:hypothetical protein